VTEDKTTPPPAEEETVASRVRRAMEGDNPEALFADEFDAAILGIGRRCGQPSIVVYSYSKCVEVLMEDGMSYVDAVEWMDFNVVGAWMGPHTPMWVLDTAWVTS
jgi:hypothetical protein